MCCFFQISVWIIYVFIKIVLGNQITSKYQTNPQGQESDTFFAEVICICHCTKHFNLFLKGFILPGYRVVCKLLCIKGLITRYAWVRALFLTCFV